MWWSGLTCAFVHNTINYFYNTQSTPLPYFYFRIWCYFHEFSCIIIFLTLLFLYPSHLLVETVYISNSCSFLPTIVTRLMKSSFRHFLRSNVFLHHDIVDLLDKKNQLSLCFLAEYVLHLFLFLAPFAISYSYICVSIFFILYFLNNLTPLLL